MSATGGKRTLLLPAEPLLEIPPAEDHHIPQQGFGFIGSAIGVKVILQTGERVEHFLVVVLRLLMHVRSPSAAIGGCYRRKWKVSNGWKADIRCGIRICVSEPDLKLDGLSLWVRGRAMPDAPGYWDRNWLEVRAVMRVGQSSVTTEGSILMADDFERFRSELARMHETLAGEASLSSYEPNLKVTLRAGSLGQIGGEIEITPDHMNEFHRFHVGFDQTYLPPLIAACEAIVDRFPVEGDPDT